MRFQFKLIPTLTVIPALIVIFALCIWQVNRMQWKEDLITKMQERVQEAPVSLPVGEMSEKETEFKPYKVKGTFDHTKEIYLINRSLNGNPGMHVYTPLIRTDGEGVFMVNRGWVPFEDHLPTNRQVGQLQGEVEVEGLLRFSKGQNMFIPDNDPVKNIWFHIDLKEMSRVTGYDLENHYIMSGNDKVPGGFPIGKQWHLDLRNNHLHYAITWFLLGVSLFGIFLIFSRKKDD